MIIPEFLAKVPAEVKQLLLDKIKTALLKELDERDRENSVVQA